MMDVVRDLLTTDVAVEKLGRRGISKNEARQLVDSPRVLVRNAGHPQEDHGDKSRWLLVGLTNGGRALTLVVEKTIDPTS